MTIGERIQMYRKQLDLSQEELGQKLLVSRQTISLWEKDQTLPTIDNLIKLREIFGIPVDNMLGMDGQNPVPEAPAEIYRFSPAKEEWDDVFRIQRRSLYKKLITFALICIILFVSSVSSSSSMLAAGFALGVLFLGSIYHIKGIVVYSKTWKNSIGRISESVYEYRVFENYIFITIYRRGEKKLETKCYFSDIEQIKQQGKWLSLQSGGLLYFMRKEDLKENSMFYSYMYKNPAKTLEQPSPDKWKNASVILFAASLLSILGATTLVGAVSDANGLFTENMWLFFLLTPIPIASTVFGFVLKAKGLKYKKNIIAGIIMTVLLCIYGSFTFMF